MNSCLFTATNSSGDILPLTWFSSLLIVIEGMFSISFRAKISARSEEHTSELQSHSDLHSFPTRRSSDLSYQFFRRHTSINLVFLSINSYRRHVLHFFQGKDICLFFAVRVSLHIYT